MQKRLYGLVLAVGGLSLVNLAAQNPLVQGTQVEVGLGWIRPNFQQGIELLRAEALRINAQSFFAAANGQRREVGRYSASSGSQVTIAFYKPLHQKLGLMLGAVVRNAQTGSTPLEGGYPEAYFFNFITAGLAAKYYPFSRQNFFAKADFGLAAVLTKNRFLDAGGAQRFFHQFGIGTAWSVEGGYAFLPFRDQRKALELKTGYQLARTRVEVDGIGDDQWQFGAWYLGTSFNF